MKERLLGTSGFPLGGSCQRPRPLTDEGKACGGCLLRVCNGKPVPHPALRGHLPPRGKALIDQYPICRFAAFSALRRTAPGTFPLYVQIKLPRRESCAGVTACRKNSLCETDSPDTGEVALAPEGERCPEGAEGENLAIARNISDSRTVLSPTACGRSPLAEGAKG